ncbi:MAG: cobalt-precorrin-6Y C(15)-methyltransferase [Thermoprotei archaeon]|nr:MAG: cobalt-precorrin-6Y C(15)-methyltransferase [Thermoprotei archaeon]RLG19194.1 MAG: cobalt-precorrin-6Y C(15)-methyltransferase [Nanoarchaeota archaeon]
MKATKEEVIGILFAKLKPRKEEVFADIGCGSCIVSNFFADYVSKVYAVDIDENIIKSAKVKENVELLHMHGLEFLKKYDYDAVFFGGSRDIEEMLEVAGKKARRIAVNLARIETACKVIHAMKESGIFKEALIVNVSKSYELAGLTAFKTINPIFMVVGGV